MDDFAGCETGHRATEAFEALGELLQTLGIEESREKACPPSTTMTFLGVEFDTKMMSMRIDKYKLQEITTTKKQKVEKLL